LWDNAYRHSVPEHVALTAFNGHGHNLTYKEINARTHCLAAYMLSKGLQRGERVLILSENQPVFLCFDLAVHFAAGVSVVLSRRFSAVQVGMVIEATAPRFVLVSEYGTYRRLKTVLSSFADKLEIICANDRHDEPEEGDQFTTLQSAVDIGKVFWRENTQLVKDTKEGVQPHQPAAILYDPHPRRKAGEKTGDPARNRSLTGIVVSHANFIAALHVGLAYTQGFTRAHKVLSFLAPTSAYQRLAGYYLPLALGQPLLLANTMAQVPALLKTEKPAVLMAAPAFLRYLFSHTRRQFKARHWLRARWFDRAVRVATKLRAAAAQNKKPGAWLQLQHAFFSRFIFAVIRKEMLSSLRYVFTSGHQLPIWLEYFFAQLHLPVVTGFGVNESTGLITLNPPQPHAARLGSVGGVIAQGSIKIQRGVLEHVVHAADAQPADTPMGIIYVGGKTLMLGTWQHNQLKPAQAWYETGFTGYFEGGHLYLQQKAKQ
jgi:long-chain acyl-CoA synthetase